MKRKMLRKIMCERGLNARTLARLTGIPTVILVWGIWGIGEFRAWEILNISRALGLDLNQEEQIFFTPKFPKGNKNAKKD